MTVQLVSVTLQIVWEMSQICDRRIFNNIIHTRMTQERAGQSLRIEQGVYVTE